jgi:hypothetical protein
MNKYYKQDLIVLLSRVNELLSREAGKIGEITYTKDFLGYRLVERANNFGGVSNWPNGINKVYTLKEAIMFLKTFIAIKRYLDSLNRTNNEKE